MRSYDVMWIVLGTWALAYMTESNVMLAVSTTALAYQIYLFIKELREMR